MHKVRKTNRKEENNATADVKKHKFNAIPNKLKVRYLLLVSHLKVIENLHILFIVYNYINIVLKYNMKEEMASYSHKKNKSDLNRNFEKWPERKKLE